MDFLLSVTAFLMALGAVFLANDAIRKVEHKNEEFIKNHVERLKKDIQQNHALLSELGAALKVQGEQLASGGAERQAIKEQLATLEGKIDHASTEIAELEAASARRRPRQSA